MSWTDYGRFQTGSESMKELLRAAEKVALTTAPVYIHGERGSGRRSLARWIFDRNPARSSRLVVFSANEVDFSAVRENDTILLENIHEFSAAQLAVLRRRIESGPSTGENRLRWIATSEIEPKVWMQSSPLAADLAYRLCVMTLEMPGLSERAEDIGPLAAMFLDVCCLMNNLGSKKLSDGALEALRGHVWTGHVAELMNAVERAALNADGPLIQISGLSFLRPTAAASAHVTALQKSQAGITLFEMEKKLIYQTLEMTRQNKTRAAQILGISIRTLRNKLNGYREEVA